MSKPRRHSSHVDEVEIFSDADFDPEIFIDAMEEDDYRWVPPSRSRPAWQRLEDYNEWRWIKEQLDDWDDWEVE